MDTFQIKKNNKKGPSFIHKLLVTIFITAYSKSVYQIKHTPSPFVTDIIYTFIQTVYKLKYKRAKAERAIFAGQQ